MGTVLAAIAVKWQEKHIRESAEKAYFAKCGLKATILFSPTGEGRIETVLEQVSREDTEVYDMGKKDLQ